MPAGFHRTALRFTRMLRASTVVVVPFALLLVRQIELLLDPYYLLVGGSLGMLGSQSLHVRQA